MTMIFYWCHKPQKFYAVALMESTLSSCFAFQSLTAALIASSASIEQCNLTGGNFRCAAMSEFLIESTSSTFFPLTHSVATELAAIAEPQPKVLNFDSTIFPSSSTLIWSFITSPHAGAPTSPWMMMMTMTTTTTMTMSGGGTIVQILDFLGGGEGGVNHRTRKEDY